MKAKFTIPSKLKPSFNVLVSIIVVLFFSPFIGVWINYSTSLYICDLYTFGISDRKDFFTVWIALFGAIGIAFNIYQNQKRTKNQDRQLENQYKQLQNQEEQLKEQEKQIALQSKSQRDSRFSKGIELLGNDNESARTGAAYSLFFLAKDYPDEFSKSVFDILCSHIRNLTTSEDYLKRYPTVISNEIQTILSLLFSPDNIALFSLYAAHLEGACLFKADLRAAYLKGANLKNAKLQGAKLQGANLKCVHLEKANLSNTRIFNGVSIIGDFVTDLSEVNLTGAYLTGAFINSSQKPFLEYRGADLTGVNWIDDTKGLLLNMM